MKLWQLFKNAGCVCVCCGGRACLLGWPGAGGGGSPKGHSLRLLRELEAEAKERAAVCSVSTPRVFGQGWKHSYIFSNSV